MKHSKVFLACLLTLLLSVSVVFIQEGPGYAGQTGEFLEVGYEFTPPQLIRSGEYHSVRIEGLDRFGKPGLPVLPYKTAKVLLPFNTEVTKVEVTCAEKITLPGSYTIEPGQQPVPIGFRGPAEPMRPAEHVYYSSRPFPEKRHAKWSVGSKRGYRFIILNLYPVEYLPLDGVISYYPKITVRIYTTAKPRTRGPAGHLPPRGRPSAGEIKIIKGLVDNPKVINSYPPMGEPSTGWPPVGEEGPLGEGASTLLEPGNYEYVLITNEALKNAGGAYTFQDLVDHKNARGTPATIVTTEWIYSNYDGTRPDGGVDDQTRIRNFIIDAYNTWGTEYVLLGGDGDGANVGGESGDNIIPARGFSVSIFMYPDTDIPSDMYYGCLDGSFDYDGDGLYGEPTDGLGGGEVDLFAEVYVGRAPVDSDNEVSNFVRKTITYENTFIEDPSLKTALILGENLGWTPWGCDYKEEVRDGSCNHGYCTVGFPGDWNITNLCDRDSMWDKNDLIPELNSGPHLVNHLGHADVNYNMKIYNSDVDGLTNDKLFFVYSQGCYSGSFDNRTTTGSYTSYDCIAEHFVTEANGAFAVVMNSRYGWGNLYDTNGPSQHFDREFFDAYFGEGIVNLGIINQDSKEDCAGYVSQDLYGRWCCYQTNLLGDPQTPIGGAGAGPAGIIALDREAYYPGGDIHVVVRDSHLNTDPETIEQYTNIIAITTTHLDEEANITLTETGSDSGMFTGTIATTDASVVSGDGVLQITCSETDTITVTYYDADDGTGNPATPSDTAYTDCLPPQITNLQVVYSDQTTATITWDTDEPAYSCVYYGTTLSLESTKCNPGQVTSHSITLTGLSPDTTYYFAVASTDEAGNQAMADNNGEYYTCKAATEVVFEDDMESGSNGWTATGFWHQVPDDTSPCPGSYSPAHSWWYGQDATCNYDNGQANSGSLISPRIELTGANPVLEFMSWEETNEYFQYWDLRKVHISTDNGASWTQLLQSTNNDADWYLVGPIDLSPYAGNAIYLKYHFDTVNNWLNNHRGWYVDDVAITYVTDCGDGRLRLDRKKYDCEAVVEITLADCHLDTDPGAIDTTSIEMASSSELDAEMVTLTETGPNSGRFEGSIQLEVGTPTPDGKLQVAEGDEIRAIYNDAFPAESKTLAAIVDCSPPLITNVEAINVVYKTATLNWDTDETADSCVYYGTALPPDLSKWTSFLVTNHAVDLTDLLPDSTYYFALASTDEAANQTIDNNNGQYYSFTTLPCVVELFIGSPSDEFGFHQNSQNVIMAFVQVCEEPAGNATVTVDFDNEEPMTLHDNGVAPDQTANDGWYCGYWTPHVTGRVTLTLTASVQGYAPVSEQVSGAVAHLVADFAAEHTYGAPPFTTQFLDLSQGDPGIENWLWEFGDGEFGTVQNPSHTYLDEGYYHVSLTINYQGVQTTKTKYSYIHVLLDPPPGIYAITPNEGWNGAPTPVTIDGYYFMDTPYVSIYGGNPETISSCGLSDPHGVYVSGNYAYVADVGSGLRVIDITDNANPSVVGTCDTPGFANGVYVSGNYAYVADDHSGLQVIDISNPANPSVVGSYNAVGVAYGVYVSGNYAYVADYVSGLQVIDITNPANPFLTGSYNTPGNAYGVYVSGNYAYVADGSKGLQVIDISNPANPYRVGWYNTAGSARGVYVSEDYAYVADGDWGLQIVNITNPASPSITGACGTPGSAKGVYVSEGYAYVADGSAGLQVIDVIDPASPSLIGSWDTDNKSLGVYISGHYAYVADGYVIGGHSQGLQVIDISNHGNPSLIGSCETPGSANNGVANGVHVSGNYAYVADGNAGLQIIDVTDPANLFVAGACDTPYYAYSVCVSGNYAYVAVGDSGLVVIDIAIPTIPSQIGGCATPGNARGVYVLGDYAYVADNAKGLQVVDISNPASPSIVGSYNTPGAARGVYAVGDYAYVADNDFGLQVIDVTNPTSPSLAGECDTPGYARGVYVSGDYAYVAGAGLNYDPPSLQVINVTDPTNPVVEGACATPDWEPSRSVYVSGGYAYVASNNAGLQVIDVTDPANPILGGACNTHSRAYGVYVSGDYVYVADWSGLRVVKSFVSCVEVNWLSDSQITATIPAGFLPGTYHLHVTNPNNAKGIMYNAFTVTLTGNAPPVVSDIPDQTIAEGNSFATINLDDYVSNIDNTDAEINWSCSGNTDLTVSITDRVATITVPNENWNGSETITFTATDLGLLSNSDDATFTVTAVNDAPVANNQVVVTDEDTPVSITLTGSDPDGDPLGFSVIAPPSNGTLGGTAPDLTYTPNADYNGSDSFTFKANDGSVDSNTATVSITVNPINDAPVANDQAVVTDEDTPVGITLTGSDPDEDPLTFSVIAPPSNGTLGGTAPDLTYTPNADYNGSDSLTFKANDGSVDSNTATVSITVNPIDDAPVANAGDNRVVFNEVTLDGSGSQDPDGTIVSYEWVLEHKDNTDYNRVIVSDTPVVVVSDLGHGFYFVTLTVTDNQGDTATDDMLLGANHQCGP